MQHLKAYLVPSRHEAGRNFFFCCKKLESEKPKIQKWTRENLLFLDIDHPRPYTFYQEEGRMIVDLKREGELAAQKNS